MTSSKYIQYQILDKIIAFIEEGLLESKSRRPGYNKMNKFYIKSEHHTEDVAYRFNPNVWHEVTNWKTYKVKVTDIQIVSDLPKDVKMLIRREVFEDILASEQ